MKTTQNKPQPGERKPWNLRNLAREYHARKNYAPYTMVWNQTLKADMMDKALAKETRVLVCIRHYAWGNFSDWAVEGPPSTEAGALKPRPMTQERIAEILGIPVSLVSKACRFLKEQGFLKADHLFLYPEDSINPSESTEVLESDSNSGNSHSPYLRFEASYLAAKKELAESIAKVEAERNSFQDNARDKTKQLRQLKREILSAWRDSERQQAEQNQQQQDATEECPSSLRSAPIVADETLTTGENEANCTYFNVLESGSNSKRSQFPISVPAELEAKPDSGEIPNKKAHRTPRPFKSLNIELETSDMSVSRSVESSNRLTDRQQAIFDAIPSELLERLHDTPTPKLLDRIEQKLGSAPLQEFVERIGERWLTITSLGILPSLAADALRVWNKGQKDAAEGIPMQTATESTPDAAEELLRRKYGIN